jgi:uncharacterized protein YcfJ
MKDFLIENENIIIGAAIGGIMGIYFGYKRGMPIWITATVGAALGGLTSKMIIKN